MAELLYTESAQLPPQSSRELPGHGSKHLSYVRSEEPILAGEALLHQHSEPDSGPPKAYPALLQLSRQFSTVNAPFVPT